MNTSKILLASAAVLAVSGYAWAQSNPSDAAAAPSSSGVISSPLPTDPATTQPLAAPVHPATDPSKAAQTTTKDGAAKATAATSDANERMNNTSADERLRMNKAAADAQDRSAQTRALSNEGATGAGETTTPAERVARADRN